MIIELLFVASLDIDPGYDDNVAKARYLQDLVNTAIDYNRFDMACEGQNLITHYMTEAGRPITDKMVQESRELAQHLCRIAEELKL